MRILITGGSGQLGGALQRTAPKGASLEAVDVEDCDITDATGLRDRIRNLAPDVLINAAAYTAVDLAETNQKTAHAVNAEAVASMVSCLDEVGGRLVQISTDFVFDGRSSQAYRPEDPRAPLSVYGASKALGEDALRATDLLLRTSWVYEAGGGNFVRTMIGLMRECEQLQVVADQIGAPTWATALARIVWRLVLAGEKGTFHYSDAGVASWYDFAVAIGEEALALGMLGQMPTIRPVTSDQYPSRATRPHFSMLDCSATHAALGTAPVHWRTHLRLMLEEEKALG